jgi:hypothetical protein
LQQLLLRCRAAHHASCCAATPAAVPAGAHSGSASHHLTTKPNLLVLIHGASSSSCRHCGCSSCLLLVRILLPRFGSTLEVATSIAACAARPSCQRCPDSSKHVTLLRHRPAQLALLPSLQLLLRLLLLRLLLLLLLPLQELRSLRLPCSCLGLLRLCAARAAGVKAATPLRQPPRTLLVMLVPGGGSLCNSCCRS